MFPILASKLSPTTSTRSIPSLTDLGLQPHLLSGSLVDSLINIAVRYRDRIDPSVFAPQVNWRSAKSERRAAAVPEPVLSNEGR